MALSQKKNNNNNFVEHRCTCVPNPTNLELDYSGNLNIGPKV